jgi:ADP-ribosylglycohydrolase
MENQKKLFLTRATAALKNLFVADSLAMPVHWFYNPLDIERAFPGGVTRLEDAPEYHPSSIMSLHSTAHGGRGSQAFSGEVRDIVGDVILKGKKKYWGRPNGHYHHRMKAGENTLNAHCARVLMRVIMTKGEYCKDSFRDAYIDFMTSDPPRHPDTYAESYHRGFFANFEAGRPRNQCGAITHDTPSIGGLVTIAPIALSGLLSGQSLPDVRQACREHLFLTHPDEDLARVCDAYVVLIRDLLFRDSRGPAAEIIARIAKQTLGLDLATLTKTSRDDRDVVGGRFSTACYISESWPSLLYLAFKYHDQPKTALLVNTNLGGDNVHRGAVLGVITGLASGQGVERFFSGLVDRDTINNEISGLLGTMV